jgi:hypothetical protein
VAYATHSTLKPVLCAPDVGWRYHPKHVELFPDINKLYNVASCWIYIGILLGAHPILHISRIRVKVVKQVEQAARNSAVVCNDLECEKYRMSVGNFFIPYSLHFMVNTTAKL